MEIEIKPLSPELLGDFLYYFDKDAFRDNPDWSFCYCQFFHCTVRNWVKHPAAKNRENSIKLINSGEMKGFLAFHNDKVVGWCNANEKSNYIRLENNKQLKVPFEGKIGAVVCFLVVKEYRGKGLARMLLKYAIEDFKRKKFDVVEAYPRKKVHTDAHNYHGPLSLFESEGFKVVKEYKTYLVVRKVL